MFVRARAPRYADHRAALRDCRPVLLLFAGSVALGVATLAYIQVTPGLYIEDVHSRLPGLLTALVFAMLAQGIAIGVRYRDELARQRRQAEAEIRRSCRCGDEVALVFDLPRQRADDAA